ncbi:MAG: polyprenyl synthetase family protein [Zetaproteobacteria bacterium]|nr:polyprenyl synthetase family protein [Zetaproteobacteria bacterium]
MEQVLSRYTQAFNTAWTHVLERYRMCDHKLSQACYYALSGEGKRVRPLLTLACAEAVGGTLEQALPAAVAVEMVHTYSLVHDDLPDFDDDDFRRGRATVHRQFDVPTAILVGDGLLTDAWSLLAKPQKWGLWADVATDVRLSWIENLSRAAGSSGMVLGQDLDMYWTGVADCPESMLWKITQHKTADLFAAACTLGAQSTGEMDIAVKPFEEFGRSLGVAFQLRDDGLDDRAGLGKSAGKDRRQEKNSARRFFTPSQLAVKITEFREKALKSIPLACQTDALLALVRLVECRTH